MTKPTGAQTATESSRILEYQAANRKGILPRVRKGRRDETSAYSSWKPGGLLRRSSKASMSLVMLGCSRLLSSRMCLRLALSLQRFADATARCVDTTRRVAGYHATQGCRLTLTTAPFSQRLRGGTANVTSLTRRMTKPYWSHTYTYLKFRVAIPIIYTTTILSINNVVFGILACNAFT